MANYKLITDLISHSCPTVEIFKINFLQITVGMRYLEMAGHKMQCLDFGFQYTLTVAYLGF